MIGGPDRLAKKSFKRINANIWKDVEGRRLLAEETARPPGVVKLLYRKCLGRIGGCSTKVEEKRTAGVSHKEGK